MGNSIKYLPLLLPNNLGVLGCFFIFNIVINALRPASSTIESFRFGTSFTWSIICVGPLTQPSVRQCDKEGKYLIAILMLNVVLMIFAVVNPDFPHSFFFFSGFLLLLTL